MVASQLFFDVVGQRKAVEQLVAAASQPVHAYLVVGPVHLGFRPLARAFTAALLCRDGGCGQCADCRRAQAGTHPDLIEVQRVGASLSVEDARRVVRLAQRTPMEAKRQVVVVTDLHLAQRSAPVLLKTLEEPPGPTVFILQADSLPAELDTIASRCVQVPLAPVSVDELTAWLTALGASPERARALAESASGSPERARLLLEDPGLEQRRRLWKTVPSRLDGTGTTSAALASELVAATEQATEPLRAQHRRELEALEEAAKAAGERAVPGRKEIEERHRREERRWRMDELRLGLGLLSAAYLERMSDPECSPDRLSSLISATSAIFALTAQLERNPIEILQLESLLVKLSAVPAH